MKATRENILRILREHPGLRKREIASYLNCHHFTIITTLHEMEEDGLVRTKYHHDPAQMEFYDRYFITDEGAQFLIFLEMGKKGLTNTQPHAIIKIQKRKRKGDKHNGYYEI